VWDFAAMSTESDTDALENTEHIPRWGLGPAGRMLFAIAVAFSAFQLWTSAYSPLPSQVIRSLHVGFLMLLFFGLVGNASRGGRRIVWFALAATGFAIGFYHLVF
jgi:TRAP-type uncharacterized transport system fused permease subunit